MYAVIKTGGKQYKVSKGEKIVIEKLEGEAGTKINFDEVLLFSQNNEVIAGAPVVKNASVQGKIIEQFRDDKIIIFKKKRRQNYRRKNGHRQSLTTVEIEDIKVKA